MSLALVMCCMDCMVAEEPSMVWLWAARRKWDEASINEGGNLEQRVDKHRIPLTGNHPNEVPSRC